MFGVVSRVFSVLVFGARFGGLITRLLNFSVIVAATKIQSQFLDSTFAVMGAVCKADGQVTHDEIRIADMLFDRLHLSAVARESAKHAFNRCKAPGLDVVDDVQRFVRAARGQRDNGRAPRRERGYRYGTRSVLAVAAQRKRNLIATQQKN